MCVFIFMLFAIQCGLLYSFLHLICECCCPHIPDRMNVAAPEGRPGGDSGTLRHHIKDSGYF